MISKLRVTFYKKGLMAYISHLDLMRLFERSLRRAALPVSMTKGFNPHPKISFSKALKLGVESDALEAVFYLDAYIDAFEFKDRMNAQLPEGIKIKESCIL